MAAVRKVADNQRDGMALRGAFPPEAYDYDEPLDGEALRRHQETADRDMAGKRWQVIGGYEWNFVRELEDNSA